MDATDMFKELISTEIITRASKDPVLAEKIKNPNKSLDKCVNYILTQVKKSGRSGFADEEVFGMAVHYFDEENVGEIENLAGKVQIVGNWKPSEEEIEKAKQNAIKRVENEEYNKIKATPKPKAKTPEKAEINQEKRQLSLF